MLLLDDMGPPFRTAAFKSCKALVPFGWALGVELCVEVKDISPCGGLSEPSGPSPSVCAVSLESAMVMEVKEDRDGVVREAG